MIKISFDNTSVAVPTVWAPQEWWKRTCEPYFQVDEFVDGTEDYVIYYYGAGTFAPNVKSEHIFSTDTIWFGKIDWYLRTDKKLHGKNASIELVVSIGPDQTVIEIFESDTFKFSSLDALRLVRSLLITPSISDGKTLVHMSMVSFDGLGIGFIGDSGAGKTSFAGAFLEANPTASLITNDKAIYSSTDNSIVGLPFAITIDERTIGNFEDFKVENDARFENGEYLFWPNDYTANLGRQTQRTEQLDVLFSVQATFGANFTSISKVVGASKLGKIAPFWDYRDSVSWNWITEVLQTSSGNDQNVHLGSGTNVYDIIGNPFRSECQERLRQIIYDTHR